jgi:hypothetical protein
MFTEDSTLLVGEPVQPTWVVDSGATHHLTAPRELLRHVRKLEEPKVFGLADRTASMNANEVGEVHVPLRSARQVTLKRCTTSPIQESTCYPSQVYSSTTGPSKCVTIRRDKERLTLRKDGQLWMAVVELPVLAAVVNRLLRDERAVDEEH